MMMMMMIEQNRKLMDKRSKKTDDLKI